MTAAAPQKCECSPLESGGYRCVCPCGVRITSKVQHVFHVCSPPTVASSGPAPQSSQAEPPSLLGKAWNFAASAARHVAAGMPMASEEDVVRRYAICQGCEHFDGKACRLCGCPVVREKQFVSKLSWAGESCPAGKWGPVDATATVNSERTSRGHDRPPLSPER